MRRPAAAILAILGLLGSIVAVADTIGWAAEPAGPHLDGRVLLGPVLLTFAIVPLVVAWAVWQNRTWGWWAAAAIGVLSLLLAIANWPASFQGDLGEWFPGVMDAVIGLMVLALVLPRWVRLAGDR